MKVAIATAAAVNYLPMGRVMAESFGRHHPDVPVLFGLSDEPDESVSPDREAFDVVRFEELGVPAPERFLFRHPRRSAAIAIKPYVMGRALDLGFDAVVYIDVDILVLDDLSDLLTSLGDQAITLVPHLPAPITEADRIEREVNILQSGAFNGGVLGVRESVEARAFLTWWQNRVEFDCRHATAEGLHYDQRWLDLVPCFFRAVGFYEDPTVNTAHWNLLERELATCRLFHFSGYDPGRPDVLTRYSSRLSFDDVPQVRPLFDRYRDAVLAAGWSEAQERPYAYDRFDNGAPISDETREVYRELGGAADRFGNPFVTDGPDSFFEWLTRGRAPTEVV
jgi:hypothetical protein